MIEQAIKKVVDKQDLNFDEAYTVMNEIMNGETSPTQNAAFLAALSTKSSTAETIDEITGSATAMREHALPFESEEELLEIVGTGGDHAGTFNISTTAAIIAAAAGAKVAKHGNRAASSQSGTADCLEALGVNIHMPPQKAARVLDESNFCFFFAPDYHASMKYVGPIRRELGIRTVFNILGPLTNPGKPTYQLLGVYDEHLLEPVANSLKGLGVKKGLVVYGSDGMDEISLSAPTQVAEIDGDTITYYQIRPEDFGLQSVSKEEILGAGPQDNARITLDILQGKPGPRRDIVLLNAGAALYAARKAESIAQGIELAAGLIDSGKALQTLERIVASSNQEAA